MNSSLKFLLAVALLSTGLYFLVFDFIAGKDELSRSLDLRSAEGAGAVRNLDISGAPVRRSIEENIAAESLLIEQTMKEKLGIRDAPDPVQAIDVLLEIPLDCDGTGVAMTPITVQYPLDSPAVKGASMLELDQLVEAYRLCEGGLFRLAHNPLAKVDTSPLLAQMRLDELKYYFIQRSVPVAALRFPDSHD
jgi:hypothetical protein